MKKFTYTITDKLGIHARPAGMFVKTVKSLDSEITVEKDGKTASGARLMALMGLGIKHGDTITVTVEGGDEEKSEKEIREFLERSV